MKNKLIKELGKVKELIKILKYGDRINFLMLFAVFILFFMAIIEFVTMLIVGFSLSDAIICLIFLILGLKIILAEAGEIYREAKDDIKYIEEHRELTNEN